MGFWNKIIGFLNHGFSSDLRKVYRKQGRMQAELEFAEKLGYEDARQDFLVKRHKIREAGRKRRVRKDGDIFGSGLGLPQKVGMVDLKGVDFKDPFDGGAYDGLV